MFELFSAMLLLLLTTIIQSSFVSQVRVLNGMSDLVLLFLISWLHIDKTRHRWLIAVLAGIFSGYISSIPYWVFVGIYLVITYIVNFIHQRIWQAPMVVLFLSTIIGSIISLGTQFVYLLITGVQISLSDGLNFVIMPSIVLNIVAILAVYAFVSEIVKMIKSDEVEI